MGRRWYVSYKTGWLLLGAALCGGWHGVAIGQTTTNTGTPVNRFDAGAINLGDRDRAYDEIAAEVALLERQGNILKRVVKVVRPSVVHIEAEMNEEESGLRKSTVEEAGSGVIVTFREKTYILTNRHVIRGAKLNRIHIKLHDGREIHPTKVWADKATDIAVLAIDVAGLAPARIGDSDKLEIGDFVLAIGSPFRLSHSVTYGIISAKGRRDLQLGSGNEGVLLQDFLQTDAAINPGNSGGPLLNLRGEVVGINTAIASNSGGSEGIGFAIPINMTAIIAQQLIEKGTVTRAFLGVQLDSRFTAELAARLGLPQPRGARISGLTPKSPAEVAGLRSGDVVLEFDGKRVDDDNHLVNLVSLTPLGREVDVVIFREGRSQALKVRVASRNDGE